MTEMVTTGTWRPVPGKSAEFVAAWAAFAEWASTTPGVTTLRLGRDTHDAGRYVSFAAWTDADAVSAWKAMPEFQDLLAAVLQHVDEFQPSELDVVATATTSVHA